MKRLGNPAQAERYCVFNKDDDSRASLCESYSKNLARLFRGTKSYGRNDLGK